MSVCKSRFRLVIAIISFLLLSACSNESSDSQQTSASGVTYVSKVPTSALVIHPDSVGTLKAFVLVYDPGTGQLLQEAEMAINGDTATVEITGLPRQVVNVEVLYTFTYPDGDVVPIAIAVVAVDLSSGIGDATIAENEYSFDYDTDGDGFTNDQELAAGTDPGDPIDVPTEICDNGIDDDFDGLTDCADTDCSSFPACSALDPCVLGTSLIGECTL